MIMFFRFLCFTVTDGEKFQIEKIVGAVSGNQIDSQKRGDERSTQANRPVECTKLRPKTRASRAKKNNNTATQVESSANHSRIQKWFLPLEFHRMRCLSMAVALLPVALHVGQRLSNHVKLKRLFLLQFNELLMALLVLVFYVVLWGCNRTI